MKRLAAVAVVVAWFGLLSCAQHGSGHGGGFSGSHGGGFSGSHSGGFSSRSAPAFHGGFNGSGPGRVAGPPRYGVSRSPNMNRAFVPGQRSGQRQPYTDPMHHRMPYRSPYGRDNRYGRFGWAGLPLWSAWGYPYLPDYMGYPDDYDSDGNQNYAGAQPYQDYTDGPYDGQPDQGEPGGEPGPAPSYTPWPYSSQPAPGNAQLASPAVTEAPVTLVFKDGRPAQQIHNYLLTSTTLTVMDQARRDIPVDQIDLTATAKVNHDAGVDFFLPGGTR